MFFPPLYYLWVLRYLVFAVAIWMIWPYIRHLFLKYELDNIPGPKPLSFLEGNFSQLLDLDAWDFYKTIAEQYGRVMKIYGLLGTRHLYIFDPKAVHHVIVKDQSIFEESPSFFASNMVAFSGGLLATHGEQHRKQRKLLNSLEETLVLKIKKGTTKEVDILHWMSRAALEMLGLSGFGYSFDSLEENARQHPFCEAAKSYGLAVSHVALFYEFILPHLVKIGSPKFRRFIVDHTPLAVIRKIRDIIDTMSSTTIGIFEEKKKALEEGDEVLSRRVEQAKDLMSILMRANMNASEEDKLPEHEVLAQMSTFAIAATDTTSNALSRTLHVLSLHPEMQDRLRAEVIEARRKYHPHNIPYDELVALPTLDAICRETLRLYPPAPKVVRVARKDAVLPLSAPIKGIDGREIDSIMVPSGTRIFVSIMDMNRDPSLWSADADQWKPDRWLSPLPQALLDAHVPGIYSHMMTFLGGGRACVDLKISQLEMKVVLSTIIARFRIRPPEGKVIWKMTGITIPMMEGLPDKAQLPLIMEQI